MTERPGRREECMSLREAAPDVALGLLTGEERAVALAHLERCEACRAEVAALAVTADEVLLAAPEATPPAGFDTRVLAGLAEHRAAGSGAQVTRSAGRAGHRRRVAVAALAAAAIALVVAGLAAVVARDEPSVPAAATVEMRTGRGRVIGDATLTGSEPALVTVEVPEWEALVDTWGEPPSGSYWLAVETRDGERTLREAPSDGEGDGWSVSVDVPADEVETVSVLDGEGRVWCSGRFSA
jgi:hypothetical protein